MPGRFDADTLALLAEAEEIELETARHAHAPHHRTILWLVVDEGRVLVRSVNGASARWFREALAYPTVTIHVGPAAIPAAVLVANDDARVAAASRGYEAKYARSPSLSAMLDEGILTTTLELAPR